MKRSSIHIRVLREQLLSIPISHSHSRDKKISSHCHKQIKKRKECSASTTAMKKRKYSTEVYDNAESKDDFDDSTFEHYDEKENNSCDDQITI